MPTSERSFTQKEKLLLCAAAVFLIAAGARFTFLAARGPALSPDSREYLRLAENLRDHGAFSLETEAPFTPSIRRPPLYPFFLAAIPASENGRIRIATIVQILADSGIAIMILLFVLMLTDLRWATGAAVAYALFPGAIYQSTAVLTETFFTALLLGSVFAVVCGLRRDRLWLTTLGGLLMGLATLSRAVSLPIPFLIAAIVVIGTRLPRRWLHALVLIVVAALVVIPWSVRSSSVSQALVLIQGASGVNFYVPTRTDWNQKDQEALWQRFVAEDPYGRRLAAARNPHEVVEADQFGFQLGKQNIRANPKAYLSSRLRTVPYLVLSSFDNFTGINSSFPALWRQHEFLKLVLKLILMLVFSLAPLVLAFIGLIPSRRHKPAVIVASIWLFQLIANLPLWIEYRFWLPAVPFLFISATLGLQFLYVQTQKRLYSVRD